MSEDERMPNLPAAVGGAAQQLPGVARIAAGASWRSAIWAARSTGRSTRLLARTVTDPRVAGELLEEVAHDVAEAAQTVSTVARRVATGTPVGEALREAGTTVAGNVTTRVNSTLQFTGNVPPTNGSGPATVRTEPEDLRTRGARLLERSRDVWDDAPIHPAFGRILDEMAPDEARILLLLVKDGPQPSVDVRTGGPVGMVSSNLVAAGLSMIGPRAGCRYLDQVPAYLNNLFRLGLVWFSAEQVEDPMEYQVVEAQPDVLEAMHSVRFSKVVRRSIHLTPFGEQFCRAVLLDPEESRELPAHHRPEE